MTYTTHDTELWKQFKAGHMPAFKSMYQRYYPGLYQFALKVTQDHDTASECLQNLFVQLWNSRKQLSDVQAIKPYLFKALRRDLHRPSKFGVQRASAEAAAENFCFSPEDLWVEDENRKLLAARIAEVLNTLPERQKEAVYLKYYEELSYKEIASVMGINYQSVVNLLFKALAKLKKERRLQQLSSLPIDCLLFLFCTTFFWLI